MGLQTKVPAVFDTAAGSPALRISATQALIGRVAKWAAGPSFTTGLSIGCLPSLSRMRASCTLIATRSRQSPVRPPAFPRPQHTGRVRVRRRQLGGVHHHLADALLQLSDRQRRRIDLVAAERIEARDQ